MAHHIAAARSQIPQIICDMCEEVFASRDNVSRDMKEVHNEEKLFECPHCPEAFSRQSKLDRHQDREKHNSR